LGCCWLLMAVLFAVGVMNLAWIAALSVFALLEKIIPRGFWAAKAAGLVLMGWGGWMAISGGAWAGVRSLRREIGLTFQCRGFICSVSQMKSGLFLRLYWVAYTGFLLQIRSAIKSRVTAVLCTRRPAIKDSARGDLLRIFLTSFSLLASGWLQGVDSQPWPNGAAQLIPSAKD
ncbi:MAG: DUF2182 domain-containing protein, partial [Deltaproteobacteria bacterium]|nr:DUF2182 domain-containing protein [Deltaproteobacteria bacterium]